MPPIPVYGKRDEDAATAGTFCCEGSIFRGSFVRSLYSAQGADLVLVLDGKLPCMFLDRVIVRDSRDCDRTYLTSNARFAEVDGISTWRWGAGTDQVWPDRPVAPTSGTLY